jgi:hypothetical protein
MDQCPGLEPVPCEWAYEWIMGWWMDQSPDLELVPCKRWLIELVIIGQDWCAGRWETIEIDDEWIKKQIISVVKNILDHLN